MDGDEGTHRVPMAGGTWCAQGVRFDGAHPGMAARLRHTAQVTDSMFRQPSIPVRNQAAYDTPLLCRHWVRNLADLVHGALSGTRHWRSSYLRSSNPESTSGTRHTGYSIPYEVARPCHEEFGHRRRLPASLAHHEGPLRYLSSSLRRKSARGGLQSHSVRLHPTKVQLDAR